MYMAIAPSQTCGKWVKFARACEQLTHNTQYRTDDGIIFWLHT